MTDIRDNTQRIGEAFGDSIGKELQKLRLVSVTVDSVDDEYAYCVLYEGNTPLPVPLKTLNIGDGFLTIKPNAGSVAVVGLIDGSGTTPMLISCAEIDKVSVKRGKTEISWTITPPERDDNGDPTDSETDDELSVVVDTSSIRIVKDLIEINGGELGDTVVIGKLTERLNKMQDEINQLQSNVIAHTHPAITVPPQTGGTFPVLTSTDISQVTFTTVQDDDYNNEKIKQ